MNEIDKFDIKIKMLSNILLKGKQKTSARFYQTLFKKR